jgi:hypothetical protein
VGALVSFYQQLCAHVAAPAGIAAEEASYLFHDFRFGPGVMADLSTWMSRALGSGSRQGQPG